MPAAWTSTSIPYQSRSRELVDTALAVQAGGRLKRLAGWAGTPSTSPTIKNSAEDEIYDQYLSMAKARRLSGWKSEFDLETGLPETISWYREFLG